ncbi:MAG TPA: sugar ABC transporter substrate-binding protein [Clostridiales bacterium]|nr:MAG: sugar ABC transporter substrate-binding protein [Clostridiales bacterium GWD2_32_59]HAN09679.1 sugar ABC transporter substrate-binding protein [Clostridiales bacterium]
MRKILIFIMCIVFTGLFIGCGSKPSNDGLIQDESTLNNKDTSENKSYNVALIMKTLTNPFFVKMEEGARRAEKELGINLIVKTGAKETSIEQQIGIVEELIEQNVDAIVIAPGSSTELVQVLKKAQDAGVKIVNIDNRLDVELSKKVGLVNVPFISVKNDEGAYLSAKYISDMIKTPTKVAIIEGMREANNAKQRKKGAEKAFSENKNINVVASETANWKIDEAYDVVSSIYKNNSDVKAIFCANDMMALGVIEYLGDNNKEDVLVAGFDNLDDAREAILDGAMTVTIDQQADVQGYTGVMQAIDLIEGKNVSLETFIPVKVVTKKDLE